MNILKKLTIKDILLNKKRNIVTIIGIILSTALICAVGGMFLSFQKTLVDVAIYEEGDFHVRFEDVSEENQKYIKNNREIDSYLTFQGLGYAPLKESQNDAKPYVYIMNFDEDALKKNGLILKSGRMPENSQELVINDRILTDAGMEYKVGDKIRLDISNRMTEDGYSLDQSNPYLNLDEDDEESEKLEKKETREYTIVGIIERPNYSIEGYSSPGYTVITTGEEMTGAITYGVKFKNIRDTYTLGKKLASAMNVNTDYNTEYLRWSGVSRSDSTLITMYGLVGVVMVIIIAFSVFVIRNSFAISTTEKMRQFGMLSSIGATKKQIRKSVFFEGTILGLVAIPIGLLCGTIATFLLVLFTKSMVGEFFANGFVFKFNMPISVYIVSILLSFITIYLSSLASAIKASRVSPIEAIRSNTEIKIKSKKLHTPKCIKELFGVGGVIAYKNLKRNKKKYRTTIISLVVSITIFISLSYFIGAAFGLTSAFYYENDYNIQLYYDEEKNTPKEIYDFLLELTKRDGIEKSAIHRENSYEITSLDVLTNPDYNLANVMSIGTKAYFDYLSALGLSYENMQDTLLFIRGPGIGDIDAPEQIFKEEMNTIDLKVDGKIKHFKVIDTKEIKPFSLQQTYYQGGLFIVPDTFMDARDEYMVHSVYIKATDPVKFEKNIEADAIKNVSVTNYQEEINANKRMILWVSVFLYGFIIVITLIGVTNIFNTITTNMNLRSKEFALLKSVGMSNREFNRMIRFESLLYGLKSLFYGILFGSGFSYLIFKFTQETLDGMKFVLPYKAIGISCLFIFVVVGMIMRYSLKKINAQNIIETIREDNN